MLVLNRRPGDAILIDGGIRLVILSCDRKSVRIGIEAPAHLGILREEIVIRIVEENKRATSNEALTASLQGSAT